MHVFFYFFSNSTIVVIFDHFDIADEPDKALQWKSMNENMKPAFYSALCANGPASFFSITEYDCLSWIRVITVFVFYVCQNNYNCWLTFFCGCRKKI
jgi:hypothetical protein